ncbi:hypothetical protein J6590_071565 [Homalodisca vitripennis]|nr:hypothetical protein J6590_071565 [Homalodisca vitripennis]
MRPSSHRFPPHAPRLSPLRCQAAHCTCTVRASLLDSLRVVPVVGRADLLCALFMFCAFLVYCQALESKTRILVHVFLLSLTVLLATASMFAKEQGITILAATLVTAALGAGGNYGYHRAFVLK